MNLDQQRILIFSFLILCRWSAIATNLPGRTDNEIKNYWNTHLKKRLIQNGIDPMTHQPKTDLFSCLPQLIALANLKELLERTQLTHNLQCLNLLQPPAAAVITNNSELATALNAMTSLPTKHEQNPFIPNNYLQEFGQERVAMSSFVDNIGTAVGGGGSQPLQQEVPCFDHEAVGQCQMGLAGDKSTSSTWNPLPPLMDASCSKTNSQENSSTVSYGGGDGGDSSFNWPDFLFEDSFLEDNLF